MRLRPQRQNHVWSYDFVEDRTHDGRKFRMVFQQPRLLNWLTVERNVPLAAEAAGLSPEHGRDLLKEVGLAGYEAAFPLGLSGGQRMALAGAVAYLCRDGSAACPCHPMKRSARCCFLRS